MGIEGGTVDLKTGESRTVTGAEFHAIIKRLIGIARTPQSQSLFGEMMMSKMVGQAENARHVATADLSGGLAHFAIELRCFFDDKHARLGTAAFQHQRGGGAGKRATDDRDIISHGEENDARSRRERQLGPSRTGESCLQRQSMTGVGPASHAGAIPVSGLPLAAFPR